MGARTADTVTDTTIRSLSPDNFASASAVTNPQSDLRLAASTMFVVDLQTKLTFDFMVTNTEIYAFYERVRELRYVPAAGAPFVDNAAQPENRLWGQDTQLQVANVTTEAENN
jgi:hypothetical protein